MGKSFWGQMPSSIDPNPPAGVDEYTTEFLYHIRAGACSNLVVFGTYCRSNFIGIQANDEDGAGPDNFLILNSGGEGTRVCYEVNKLSGPFDVISSGNKCGSSPEAVPFQSQFILNYPDPHKVVAYANVMDSSAEMEVHITDGDLEIQTARLDQQVARSGFWVDAPGSLKISGAYSPEIAAFAGDGTIEASANYMPLGAADSDNVRLTNLWRDNILGKGRGALAGTYENPYFYGLEILDTADSDSIPSVDPFNSNNWFSCTQPVLVSGQSKKKLYLDVVNPDLVGQSITGKVAVGIHTTDTEGVVGDTMVHVYYDQNGQTLAGSFDAADPANAGKWKNISFDITGASFTNGINGGDVLIEIGADAVVSVLYVEIRDNEKVCEFPELIPPSAPGGLVAVPGDHLVSLNWSDNAEDDLAGYSVYRSTNSGIYGAALVTNLVSSDYVDHTVSNGTTYYYVVTASDTNSNESATSGEASATPVLQLSVIVDFENIGKESSQSATFTNLHTTIESSNGAVIPMNSFTAAMDSGESFAFTVGGVDDWVYAAALAASNKLAYLGGLNTATGLAGNGAGWGPGQAANNEKFDHAGEALVIEFDLSGLTAAHQSGFRLEGLNMGIWNDGPDVYNYMVIDASGNTITSSANTQQSETLPLNIAIHDGDYLIVGYEGGEFKLDKLLLDVLDGYDQWVLEYGGSEVIGSSTNDYDGDGQVNLVEYALDGNPTNILDAGEESTVLVAGSHIRYIHPQRSDDPELIYTVQVSTNLISGGWTNDYVTAVGTNVTGETLNYVTNQVPDAEPNLFMRLKMEMQ